MSVHAAIKLHISRPLKVMKDMVVKTNPLRTIFDPFIQCGVECSSTSTQQRHNCMLVFVYGTDDSSGISNGTGRPQDDQGLKMLCSYTTRLFTTILPCTMAKHDLTVYHGSLTSPCTMAEHDLTFTFLLVWRMASDAVTDVTPGIWSHVPPKRFNKVGYEGEPVRTGFEPALSLNQNLSVMPYTVRTYTLEHFTVLGILQRTTSCSPFYLSNQKTGHRAVKATRGDPPARAGGDLGPSLQPGRLPAPGQESQAGDILSGPVRKRLLSKRTSLLNVLAGMNVAFYP
ncbi:hypothetical protein J6590_007657 [Homalodisca vitripennis]|nr:hypothetical protein J6590_007657 [Homalodisca vitripennis]